MVGSNNLTSYTAQKFRACLSLALAGVSRRFRTLRNGKSGSQGCKSARFAIALTL